MDESYSFWLKSVAATLGGLGVAIVSLLYVYQNKLLYMPNPPGMPIIPEDNPTGCITPAEWCITGNYCEDDKTKSIPFEDVMITTDDNIQIHAWLLINNENAPTIIYFHGNAGNMGFRLQNAAGMYGFSGYNVLMMDYRGYGKSTGIPTEIGLQKDAIAVMKYIKLSNSPIVPFGRSLGGAVAIWLAYHYPTDIHGIIIENTFLSIPDMVDVLLPYVKYIKWLVLRISWNSKEYIRELTQPILFISGEQDELVPTGHMLELHRLANKSVYKELYSVARGSHNDTWQVAGYNYYKVYMLIIVVWIMYSVLCIYT